MEYKNNKLSDSFKGILYYIDKNNTTKITNIREDREFKWCNKTDVTNEHLIYLPQNNEIYEIDKDIFIEIGTREKKIESGRSEVYQDLTSLTLFSQTKDIIDLKKFLRECQIEYQDYIKTIILSKQSLFNCTYDSAQKNLDVRKIDFNSNRTFENLFFDQKNDILKKVDKFINGHEWYDSKGIPYTLGILLYGEPGCGKTSFIKALMKYVDKYKNKKVHGIYVNLHDTFDFDELEKIISSERLGEFDIPLDRRLYIFEDIDCMGDVVKDRDLKEKNNKKHNKMIKTYLESKIKNVSSNDKDNNLDSGSDIDSDIDSFDLVNEPKMLNVQSKKNSLARLLNILDGIIETPGRIIIMTTNKINMLDKALIRPGRIDIKINFTKCSKTMIKDIINMFYDININLNKYRNIPEFTITPAELVQKCFEFDDYNKLLSHLNN